MRGGAALPPGVVYVIGRSLYVALTNSCNTTPLIESRGLGFQFKSKFTSLPNGYEPSAKDVTAAVGEAWNREASGFDSIVFAGYGEPTLKLEELLTSAKELHHLRPAIPLRLNTNGLANAHYKRDIVLDLATSGIQSVSVQLNTADADQYLQIMKPKTGQSGLDDVCSFVRNCMSAGIQAEVTAVERPDVDMEAVQGLAKELGVELRTRSFHPGPGEANL